MVNNESLLRIYEKGRHHFNRFDHLFGGHLHRVVLAAEGNLKMGDRRWEMED